MGPILSPFPLSSHIAISGLPILGLAWPRLAEKTRGGEQPETHNRSVCVTCLSPEVS